MGAHYVRAGSASLQLVEGRENVRGEPRYEAEAKSSLDFFIEVT
jgi:hypothetical protein